MIKRFLSLMVLGALSGSPVAASDWLAQETPHDTQLGRSVRGTFRPAFKAVEALSDGVYDFMRSRVAGAILPSRLSRGMRRAPREESFSRFARHVELRETRYIERTRQAYPVLNAAGGRIDEHRLDQWRGWALNQQRDVLLGAFEQTLLERYALDRFAKDSGHYALQPGNWDAGFLMTAGVLGGALIYVNGLNVEGHVGAWRVGVNLRSGNRLRQAVDGDGDAAGLAALEIGPRGSPWSANAQWGARDGELVAERFGVNYNLRF